MAKVKKIQVFSSFFLNKQLLVSRSMCKGLVFEKGRIWIKGETPIFVWAEAEQDSCLQVQDIKEWQCWHSPKLAVSHIQSSELEYLDDNSLELTSKAIHSAGPISTLTLTYCAHLMQKPSPFLVLSHTLPCCQVLAQYLSASVKPSLTTSTHKKLTLICTSHHLCPASCLALRRTGSKEGSTLHMRVRKGLSDKGA